MIGGILTWIILPEDGGAMVCVVLKEMTHCRCCGGCTTVTI
jgi:hypothetical protein